MLPKRPPRDHRVGFIYSPPWRIQGISVGGEQTVIQVPELGLNFDIGLCPRIALAAEFTALSHGHMDHVAGLPYWFSQRSFMKMSPGICFCHPELAKPLQDMMGGWVGVENQATPHQIIPLCPGESYEIKPSVSLVALQAQHTVPSLSYAVVEKRSKLKPEFHGRAQTELRKIKADGTEITYTVDVPIVAYTGDTEMNPSLVSTEFCESKIVITECTFFEEEHIERARVGKHLHIEHLKDLMSAWKAETVVLAHLSRRSSLDVVRKILDDTLGDEAGRICLLMDHYENRNRYENQCQNFESVQKIPPS